MTSPARLAWAAARAFVTACETGTHYVWLQGRVTSLLGPEYQRALTRSRHRVVNPRHYDARLLEADIWRHRLTRTLERRPELAEALRDLYVEADTRLSQGTRDDRTA
ncbi:MAG TPA: hypothetical protein VFY17_03195 [Pilimelia sp.]|nr:hypothetical protein [Pilimelia sp.]